MKTKKDLAAGKQCEVKIARNSVKILYFYYKKMEGKVKVINMNTEVLDDDGE